MGVGGVGALIRLSLICAAAGLLAHGVCEDSIAHAVDLTLLVDVDVGDDSDGSDAC